MKNNQAKMGAMVVAVLFLINTIVTPAGYAEGLVPEVSPASAPDVSGIELQGANINVTANAQGGHDVIIGASGDGPALVIIPEPTLNLSANDTLNVGDNVTLAFGNENSQGPVDGIQAITGGPMIFTTTSGNPVQMESIPVDDLVSVPEDATSEIVVPENPVQMESIPVDDLVSVPENPTPENVVLVIPEVANNPEAANQLLSDLSCIGGTCTVEHVDGQVNVNITLNDPTLANVAGSTSNNFSFGPDTVVNIRVTNAGQTYTVTFVLSDLSDVISNINGRINAPDIILAIINPAGINIGSEGSINAQGVLLSTMQIKNMDAFLQHGLNGMKLEGKDGMITNNGNLNGKDFVALVANAVANHGSITVTSPVGNAVIATGEVVTVGVNGNGSISVGVDKGVAGKMKDANGNPITSQIHNKGNISAARVSMQAKALDDVFSLAINQEGVVRTTDVVEKDGIIELIADGDITNTGTLESDKIHIEGKDIISSGELNAAFFYERGASFKLSGSNHFGDSDIENLDGAMNLGTGNYSGVYSDAGNIIIDPNAIITLIGDTSFFAANGLFGSGNFIMELGSSIVGNNFNLTLQGDTGGLRNIIGVNDLTLQASTSGAFGNFVLQGGQTISTIGDVNIAPLTALSLLHGSTFQVGGQVNIFGIFSPNMQPVQLFIYGSAAGNLGDGLGGNLRINAPDGGVSLQDSVPFPGGGTYNAKMEGTMARFVVLSHGFGGPSSPDRWNMQGNLTVTDSILVQGQVNMGTNDLNMTNATGTWLNQNGLQPNGNNVYINNNAKIEFEALATSPGGFGLNQGTLTNVIYNTNAGTVEYTGDARSYGVQAGEYHNLVLSTASGLSSGGAIQGDVTVHGDLTIAANAGMEVGEDINGNGYTLSMGDPATGTFSNDGMLTFVDDGHAVNTVNDSNSGIIRHLDYQGGTYNLPMGNDYNTLILNATGGGFGRPATWNATGDVTINNSLLMSNDGTNLHMGTHDLNMANATGSFLNQHGYQGANGNNIYNFRGTIEYDVQPGGLFGLGTDQGTLTNVIYNTNFGTVRYTGGSALAYNVQGGGGYHNLEIDANAFFGGVINKNTRVHGDLTITGNGALNVADGTTLVTLGGFSNDGRLLVTDNAQLQNFTNDTDSGAVWYLDTQNNTYNNLEAGTAYNDVWFISADLATGSAGNGNWTPQGNLDVNGDFLHIGGTFNAPAQINVAGDFVRDIGVGITGTFNANGGTVILDGVNQMITGNTTFNNLEKVGPNETLLFQAGSTQTMTGTATLRGDATGNLTLNAVSGIVNIGGFDFDLGTTPSGRWNIDPAVAGRDISFVSVGNSENFTGPAIDPSNSTDLGNTVLWFPNIVPPGGGGGGFGNAGNIGNALLEQEQPQLPGIEINGDLFLKSKISHCAATQAGIDMPSSVHNGVMLNSPDEKLPVGICGEISPKSVGFGAKELRADSDSFVPFEFAN